MIKYVENIYPDFTHFDKIPKLYHIKPDFEKAAYAMADPIKEFIEGLKPSKDSSFYWVNAMGSGEIYGANNRGDYFPRQELIDNHGTFVTTPARVYIQHINKDPRFSLGEVIYSFFNHDTDRVELVERVDWPLVSKFAPDWLRYALQRDEQLNTSMGCNVAYDECSYCGNKAKYKNEYCTHALTNMNNFIEGKKIFVKNKSPRFFDNSFVKKGADRTARVLSKVASDYENTITNDEEYKKIFSLSDIKDPKDDNFKEAIDTVFKDSPVFSKEFMDSLCIYELEDILGTTKVAGIELTPEEYQYIALKKLGQDDMAVEYFDNNKIFELKSHEPQAIQMNMNPELFEKVSIAVYDRSFYKPFMLYRGLAKEATNHIESPKKWTVNDDLSDVLSKGYSNYINTSLVKQADILTPLLFTLFMALPQLVKLQNSKKTLREVERRNIQGINEDGNSLKIPSINQGNMISPLPVFVTDSPVYNTGRGIYNPIYKNQFIESSKTASDGMISKIKGLNPRTTIPLAVGIGGTMYLAGKDKERELTGDMRAGTGISGAAQKHPLITGGGLALGTHLLTRKIFKKASDLEQYKDFLRSIDNKNLFLLVNKIPDDIMSDLIF